jgi:prefoldin subunit 5
VTNFESLRELVQQGMPQQLEAFDRLAFRLRRFQYEDDLILFIEAAGFVALLTHQVPKAIMESNAAYRTTLETLKEAVESTSKDKARLERAHAWAEQTAKELDSTCKRIKSIALDVVTNLDTKALSEKLSAALLQSIDQSVQARGEIDSSAKALREVGLEYRDEVKRFNRLRISRAVALAWLSAALIFGAIYFVTWENHRHLLDAKAQARLAATLDAARQLQRNGVDLKVVRDHETVYLIIPGASKAYLSDAGVGVIAIQAP